jgi:hypothetical protein
LRDLGIRLPLDIHDAARRLQARRGKPIKLIAAPLPVDGPSGYWLPTRLTDFVWYQQSTTLNRQRLIVMHEFWHMIANHECCGADIPGAVTALMSTVSSETVSKMLRRYGYDDGLEWEAETAASIINRWSKRAERAGRHNRSSQEDGWIDSALGSRLGSL